jgi:hypothetical protein
VGHDRWKYGNLAKKKDIISLKVLIVWHGATLCHPTKTRPATWQGLAVFSTPAEKGDGSHGFSVRPDNQNAKSRVALGALGFYLWFNLLRRNLISHHAVKGDSS